MASDAQTMEQVMYHTDSERLLTYRVPNISAHRIVSQNTLKLVVWLEGQILIHSYCTCIHSNTVTDTQAVKQPDSIPSNARSIMNVIVCPESAREKYLILKHSPSIKSE